MSLLKTVLLSSRRAPIVQATRGLFGLTKEMKTPDDVEHATGKEKVVLLLEEKGITDPFHFNTTFKRGEGTKEKPNLIPTFEDRRLVGCICEEDATNVNYFWLHLNDPKRCECGHWFKAIEAPDYEQMVASEMFPPKLSSSGSGSH